MANQRRWVPAFAGTTRCDVWLSSRLASADRGLRRMRRLFDRVRDAPLLGLELRRHARTKRIKILADIGNLVAPGFGIDIEQRIERTIAETQAVGAQIAF